MTATVSNFYCDFFVIS